MEISKLCGLVVPTHCSSKGNVNAAWGPPTVGWVSKTLERLWQRVPGADGLPTWIVLNHHGGPLDALYERNLKEYVNGLPRHMNLRIDSSPGYRGVRCNLVDWFPRKYLFLVEHDWEFLEDIDLEKVLNVFETTPDVNFIRFNKRPNTVFPKQCISGRMGAELYCDPVTIGGVDLCQSPHYTNNPHIERVSKLREWVDVVRRRKVNVGGNGGAGGFEHPLQEESLDDLQRLGKDARDRQWGTYIYGGLNHPTVVQHFGN